MWWLHQKVVKQGLRKIAQALIQCLRFFYDKHFFIKANNTNRTFNSEAEEVRHPATPVRFQPHL